MSVLGTISLSGLTTTNSDYITTASLEVTNSLTVANGATITLPNNSITDNELSTNVMFLDGVQTSTGDKNFATTAIDGEPLQIQFLSATLSEQQIRMYPYASDSTGNPFTLDGDTVLVGTGNFTVGKYDRYNAVRFTDTDLTASADTQLNLYVGSNNAVEITDASFNLSRQFISNYTSTTVYENQFAGSIWCEKDVTCKNGLWIQNQITPGATTYASINNLGQAILATLSCPTITTTTQANADNSTKVATTAFVKNQNYITTAALSNYAQLTGVPQTFSNLNTFSQSITGVTEATADNSTKLASTAFVKNQAYITASALTPYALLGSSNTFTATNTFNGRQTFTQTQNNTYPFLWRSNNAPNTTRQGYIGVTTSNGNFNGVATANDCVIMAADTGSLDVGVLCLTTHSNTSCGIRITNANVLMTGTTIQTTGTLQANNALTVTGITTTNGALNATSTLTVTGTTTTNGTLAINNAVTGPSTNYATTSSNIGYTNKITYSSWLATITNTAQNLYQFVFDNGANYKYGTYRIEYNVRMTSTVNTQGGAFNFDTTSASTNSLYMVALNSNAISISSTYYYIWRASFILPIYATTTWYFNGNSNVATMDTNSYVQITRLS